MQPVTYLLYDQCNSETVEVRNYSGSNQYLNLLVVSKRSHHCVLLTKAEGDFATQEKTEERTLLGHSAWCPHLGARPEAER